MRTIATRRARRVRIGVHHLTHDVAELRARDAAGPQESHPAAETGDDRGFQADFAVAAVQHQRDTIADAVKTSMGRERPDGESQPPLQSGLLGPDGQPSGTAPFDGS